MWAFVMITPLAGEPVLTIVLAMGAAALLEIAATVLPAIALAPASSAPHIAAPTSDSATPREHTPSASNTALPGQPQDLLGLLTSVATTGTPPEGSQHLQCTDDGSIETTQAALAKVMGCSKSSINRRLCALEKSVRIRVSTSVHGTRITLIGTQ